MTTIRRRLACCLVLLCQQWSTAAFVLKKHPVAWGGGTQQHRGDRPLYPAYEDRSSSSPWGTLHRIILASTTDEDVAAASQSSSSASDAASSPPSPSRSFTPAGGRRGGGGERPVRHSAPPRGRNFNNGRVGGGGSSFSRSNNRSGGARPVGGGGGGPQRPSLTLVNPLKVQRIVPEFTPPSQQRRQQQQQQQQEGGGGERQQRDSSSSPRDRRPVTSISDRSDGGGGGGGGRTYSDGGGGGGGGAPSSSSAPAGRGGKWNKKSSKSSTRPSRGGGAYGGDGPPQRRVSLRASGMGSKKGRKAQASQRRGNLKRRDRTAEKEAKAEAAAERRTVQLPDGPVMVSELAEIIDEKPVAVIKFLMTDLGVMASMTQSLDPATCKAVAEGFGKIVGEDDEDDEEDDEYDDTMTEESALASGVVLEDDDPEDLLPRAPVVTIMGHVDHGKTSLLDAIRNTRVTAGEAGGITQHIAAYQVQHNGNPITFIDTPGHAAFTDMRERGANITDLVILVVAADDGVKQQTADSIVCARQAGVPLVVAINKCDLETADPTKVMTDLTGYDVLTEEFGGDIMSSQISAKQGTNLDDLLDKVMLQAEMQDLKANPDRDAECIVVEANVEKGLGTVATTLVKKGTIKVGDIFVAGEAHGRVRALISTADGKTRLKEAGPSVPVRVVGFEGIPAAGDLLVVARDEQTARELAESRQRIAREKQSSSYQAGLMDTVANMAFGSNNKQVREMCVLVKADVQGSAEALTRSLRELKLQNDEAVVAIKVLVSEAGEVSKSDIAIAGVTPDTTVIAFNVAASQAAMDDARAAGIPIEYYSIVYDAIESVESRMQEVLSPTPDGEYVGAAKVQEVFNIGGTGNIAGSRCTDGVLRKGGNVRVMRGDKILVETKIKSLRNFKAEVDVIEEGNECGIGLLEFEQFEPDDVIECYVE